MDSFVPLKNLLSERCPCGRTVHDDPSGKANMYTINKNDGSVVLLSLEATPNDLNTSVRGSYQSAFNFLRNQKRVFPEKTCPYVLSSLMRDTPHFDFTEKFEEHTKFRKILKAMGDVCDLKSFDPPTHSYYFENNHQRIVETMTSIPGNIVFPCPCGFKHKINNQIYDLVFIMNNRLIGVDLQQSLITNLYNICDQCDISYSLVMYVFVGLFNAFFEFAAYCKDKKYCHGGIQKGTINKVINKSIIILDAFKKVAVEQRYQMFIQYYISIQKNMGYSFGNNQTNNLSTLNQYLQQYSDQFSLKDGSRSIEEKQEEENEKNKFEGLYQKEQGYFKNDILNALEIDCNENKSLKEIIKGVEEKEVKLKQEMTEEKEETKEVDKMEEVKEVIKMEEVKEVVKKEVPKEEIIKKEENNAIPHQAMGSPRISSYSTRQHPNNAKQFGCLDDLNKDSPEFIRLTKNMDKNQIEAFRVIYNNMFKERDGVVQEKQMSGHKLKDDRDESEEVNGDEDGIEIKEYCCANSNKDYVVKVQTKYSTVVFYGNEETTVKDLIGHIKFNIQKDGNEVYCGVLKQRMRREEFNNKLDSKLCELKIYKTMLVFE